MFPSELPSNLHQVQAVVTADEKGFVLADGTYIEADAIIYCTGNVDVAQPLDSVSQPKEQVSICITILLRRMIHVHYMLIRTFCYYVTYSYGPSADV